MKKVITFMMAILLLTTVFGQAPDRISYQAVIRNSNDELVINKQIGIKISIQKVNFGLPPTYSDVFIETHLTTTNENGLISILIGGGTKVSGSVGTINWSSGAYTIKSDIDLAGGKNYTITGRGSIASVPFALNSQTVENVQTDATLEGKGNTGDPLKLAQQNATKGQTLQWNGTTWSPGLNHMFSDNFGNNFSFKRFGIYNFRLGINGSVFIPEKEFLKKGEGDYMIITLEVGWNSNTITDNPIQYRSLKDGISYEIHFDSDSENERGIKINYPNKSEYHLKWSRFFYVVF